MRMPAVEHLSTTPSTISTANMSLSVANTATNCPISTASHEPPLPPMLPIFPSILHQSSPTSGQPYLDEERTRLHARPLVLHKPQRPRAEEDFGAPQLELAGIEAKSGHQLAAGLRVYLCAWCACVCVCVCVCDGICVCPQILVRPSWEWLASRPKVASSLRQACVCACAFVHGVYA